VKGQDAILVAGGSWHQRLLCSGMIAGTCMRVAFARRNVEQEGEAGDSNPARRRPPSLEKQAPVSQLCGTRCDQVRRSQVLQSGPF
jgi:hypothetical protein